MTFPPPATPAANTIRGEKWDLPASPPIQFRPLPSTRAPSDTKITSTSPSNDIVDVIQQLAQKENIRVLNIYKTTLPLEDCREPPEPIEENVYWWDCIVAAGSRSSRRRKSEEVYLIKWTGYPKEEMTWETKDDLAKEDLSALWKAYGPPQAGKNARRKRRRKVAGCISAKKQERAALKRKYSDHTGEGRHSQGTISDTIPNPCQPVAAEDMGLCSIEMANIKTDNGESTLPTPRTITGLPKDCDIIMDVSLANIYFEV